MTRATHRDVVRLVPAIEDHAIVEILAMGATVPELEAALAELSNDDGQLIEVERRRGDRLHRLLGILRQASIEPESDR